MIYFVSTTSSFASDSNETFSSSDIIVSDNNLGSFDDLNSQIQSSTEISLDKDYSYNNLTDSSYKNGIIIKDKTITINGNGHSISSNNQARLFDIRDTGYLILNNVSLINDNDISQASIINHGQLAIINSSFQSIMEIKNVYAIYGPIYNTGSLTVDNTIFKDSDIRFTGTSMFQVRGGIIYNTGALNIKNTLFENNTINTANKGATNTIYGALFYNSGGNVILDNISVINNYATFNAKTATQFHGFIVNSGDSANIKINKSNFSNNNYEINSKSYAGFGLIRSSAGTIEIDKSYFENNSGYTSGVISNLGNLFVSNSVFCHNYARLSGGVIFNQGNLTSMNNIYRSNRALIDGGAIYNFGYYHRGENNSGNLYSYNDLFDKNAADAPTVDISQLVLGAGGAVYSDSGNMTFKRCNFTGNVVNNGNGGAIANKVNGHLTVTDSLFINNQANTFTTWDTTGAGGAICILAFDHGTETDVGYGYTKVKYSIFLNNTAKIGTAIYSYEIEHNHPDTSLEAREDSRPPLGDVVPSKYYDVIANYNYWGTNTPDFVELIAKPVGKRVVFPVNWIIMGIDGADNVKYNGEYNYTITLNQIMQNGAISALDNYLPDFEVMVSSNSDKNYSLVMISNGTGKYYYTNNIENNDVISVYNQDDFVVSKNINVNSTGKKLTELTANNIVLYYKNGTRYEVILIDGNGNPLVNEKVNIIISGVSYVKSTDGEGKTSIAINLIPGTYSVTVRFNGSDVYQESEITNNITVLSTIGGKDVVMYFCNGTKYCATFLDGNGAPLANVDVRFNINGVFYKRTTDVNGVASLNIRLNPGNYIITAIHPNGQMFSNNIEVLSTIGGKDVVMYFCNGTKYCATFLDGNGAPLANVDVRFNINGVFYKRTTDVNGVASLNIRLNPGNYIITAIHPNGQMFSNNIEVLPVLTGSDLNMKFDDGSKYGVKLVDGSGNPVSGVNITMNINGVFYNKLTDSEGIARLNIRLLPGEYIITSMYDRAVTSNKITIRG